MHIPILINRSFSRISDMLMYARCVAVGKMAFDGNFRLRLKLASTHIFASQLIFGFCAWFEFQNKMVPPPFVFLKCGRFTEHSSQSYAVHADTSVDFSIGKQLWINRWYEWLKIPFRKHICLNLIDILRKAVYKNANTSSISLSSVLCSPFSILCYLSHAWTCALA